jgi:hypothetical protein
MAVSNRAASFRWWGSQTRFLPLPRSRRAFARKPNYARDLAYVQGKRDVYVPAVCGCEGKANGQSEYEDLYRPNIMARRAAIFGAAGREGVNYAARVTVGLSSKRRDDHTMYRSWFSNQFANTTFPFSLVHAGQMPPLHWPWLP